MSRRKMQQIELFAAPVAEPVKAAELTRQAERLLGHFEVLAEAEGGIERLRGLILDLAIQGRLLSAEGSNGGRNAEDATMPFALPTGWSWNRWEKVAVKIGDIDHKMPETVSDGIPYVSPRDFLPNNGIDFDNAKRISVSDFSRLRVKIQPEVGDLIYPRYGTIGECRLVEVERDFLASYSCAVIKTQKNIVDPKYQYYYSISSICRDQARKATNTTTQPNVGIRSIKEFLIPLPPLAEQKRIVAKVDELMKLCDEMEARQAKQRETGKRLTKAALDALATAEGPEELAAAWERVVGNFEGLISRADDVKKVRETVLSLAVRGRLVRQDPADEAAARPAKKKLPNIGRVELPFELPPRWYWYRLGELAEFINGDRGKNYPDRAEYVPTGIAFINTGHIEPDGTLSIREMNYLTREKFDSLRSGKVKKGDLVYCLRGATLGKTAIITQFEEGAIASSLVIIRPSRDIDSRYAYHYLLSPLGRELIRRFDNGSAQPNLSGTSVEQYVVPLPPLAEQKRIVAKVDQLMALCDELETKLRGAEEKAQKVAEALVAELLDPGQG